MRVRYMCVWRSPSMTSGPNVSSGRYRPAVSPSTKAAFAITPVSLSDWLTMRMLMYSDMFLSHSDVPEWHPPDGHVLQHSSDFQAVPIRAIPVRNTECG